MLARKSRLKGWIAGSGFAVGLALGVGLLVGSSWRGSSIGSTEIPLHALATHGTDTMAVCTLPIEEGMEGLATLDYLTGELRIFVMNRRSYTFTAVGKVNVLGDLKVERGKKVNLLMVSGQTTFVGGAGAGARPATSTLYVCDANTGMFVAYGMLYPPTAIAAAAPTEIAVRKLDVGTARSLNLSE